MLTYLEKNNMDTVATFRAMMNRLGFNNNAANHIFAEQGIDLPEDIYFLSSEGIYNLLKTIFHGGNQIIYPTDVAITIPASGFLVSNIAEENFKLLAYYLRHMERTS